MYEMCADAIKRVVAFRVLFKRKVNRVVLSVNSKQEYVDIHVLSSHY